MNIAMTHSVVLKQWPGLLTTKVVTFTEGKTICGRLWTNNLTSNLTGINYEPQFIAFHYIGTNIMPLGASVETDSPVANQLKLHRL
jgi:hypothetical protein